MRPFRSAISEPDQVNEADSQLAEEGAVLDQIGRVAGSSPSLREVCQQLADEVRKLVPFDRMSVGFLDLENGTFTEECAVGLHVPRPGRDDVELLAGTVIEEAVAKRSGVLAADMSPDALVSRYPGLKPVLVIGIRAVLAEPLISDGKVLAALVLASVDPNAYSKRHGDLVQRIGERIAGAIANSRRYAALQAEAAELATMAEMGRIVGSSSDIVEVYHLFVQKVRTLIPFDRLVIAMVDLESDTSTTAYVSGEAIPGAGVGSTSKISGSATETVVSTRSGVLDDGAARGVPGNDAELPSMMTVPLISGDQVISTLTFSSSSLAAYSDRDIALAERIAAQVAGAVDRSWLHSQLRRESQEAEVLAEIDLLMSSPLDIDAVYERFAGKVRTLIPFDRLVIARLDREAGEGTIAFLTGLAIPGRDIGTSYEADADAFQELVGVYSGVLATADSANELGARFPRWPFLTSGGVHSIVAVPLISKDQVFAALVLCSTKADAYEEADLALARRIGSQVAGAIVNDQLRTRLRRETEDGEVLAAIRRIISSAPAIEDVYDYAAERVRRLVPFDRIDIATVDMDGDNLTHRYVSGIEIDGGDEEAPEPVAGTIMEEAMRSHSPLLVQAESEEELESRFPSLKPDVEAGLRSFIVTPLLSGDVVVGALTLGSTLSDAYTDRHFALAERVGFGLAGAMAGVRVRTGQVPDAGELAALSEIGRIITSSVDIGEVYERFAVEVRKLISFDRIVIWTVDLQRQNLTASYVWGEEMSGLQGGRSILLSSSVAQAALSGSRDPTEAEGTAVDLAQRFAELLRDKATGQPAMLLVPLVSDNETVGMLSLRSTTAGRYARRDVAVAERIAGQIAGAVANARVYMESKQVESAVREAVERLDLAVGGSGDGLWDWKIPENEVWWSPRFKELVGFRQQEQAGGVHGLESQLHPEDRERVQSALNDHLAGQGPYDVEFRLRNGSGEYIWVSDRGQAMWDESGTAVRMSGSLRDVTDVKEGTVRGRPGAYDLRTPLAIVEGFRQALLMGRATQQDGGGEELVSYWQAAGRQVTQLTHELETLSRVIDSPLRRRSVDLTAMARSVVRSLRGVRPKRKIAFSIAEHMVVKGDPGLLRVLMENLLENAWKYTGKRRRARVEVRVAQRDGETVYYVRDNGAGFDMADADRLFGLFQRLHPAAEFEGAGVGLATVQHIVRRHGGSVWAEGQVEGGATFYFSI